jgi:hypothetical protein
MRESRVLPCDPWLRMTLFWPEPSASQTSPNKSRTPGDMIRTADHGEAGTSLANAEVKA